MDIKKFFESKKVGWYISLAACVLALVALIVYCARGGNRYSPISGAAIAMLVIGIVLNAGVLFKDFGVGAFLPFIFYTVALGILANTEMVFMTNVLFAVDNHKLDPAWFAFVIFEALAVLTSLVACVLKMSKPVQKA